jgi:hypothetical protein
LVAQLRNQATHPKSVLPKSTDLRFVKALRLARQSPKGGLLSPREDVGSLTQEFKNPTSTKNLRTEEAEKIRRVRQVDAVAVCQAEIYRCG